MCGSRDKTFTLIQNKYRKQQTTSDAPTYSKSEIMALQINLPK